MRLTGTAVIRRLDVVDGELDNMMARGNRSASTSAGREDESIGGNDEVWEERKIEQ